MRGTAVGLYCAVGQRFDTLVPMRTGCSTQNASGLQPAGREPAHMVECTEPWFRGGRGLAARLVPRHCLYVSAGT
jgi:hypothetical protein